MPTRRYEISLVVQTQQNQAQQQLNAVAASVQSLNRQIMATTAGIVSIQGAWHVATAAASAYKDKLKELDDQARQMAQAGLTKQERLGEYGYLLGVRNDQELRKKVDAFGAKTGLNESGQIGFLTKFESTAGQYRGVGKGGTMATEQVDRYQELVAKRAAQMHISPEIVADLGAGILGNTDWNAMAAKDPKGHDASTLAFTQFEQVLKELAVGRGENKRLLADFVKALTMQIKVNRSEGTMRGDDAPVRMAAMLSAVAEVVPTEAGTYLNRAIEGVRMIDKKKGAPWYKKAGIDLTVEPDVAMAKMSEYYEAHPEIHKPGENIDDFLRSRVGLEFRRSKGMGAVISGMRKGLVSNRLKAAASITPDNAVSDMEDSLKGNVTIESQQSEQALAQTTNEQGDEGQRLKVARQLMEKLLREKQGFGKLGADPRSGFWFSAIRKLFNNTAGFALGQMDDKSDIDAALIALMSQRAEAMGTTRNDMTIANMVNPDWRQKALLQLDRSLQDKTGETMVDLLKKLVAAVEAQKEQHAAGVPNNGQMGGMVKP